MKKSTFQIVLLGDIKNTNLLFVDLEQKKEFRGKYSEMRGYVCVCVCVWVSEWVSEWVWVGVGKWQDDTGTSVSNIWGPNNDTSTALRERLLA